MYDSVKPVRRLRPRDILLAGKFAGQVHSFHSDPMLEGGTVRRIRTEELLDPGNGGQTVEAMELSIGPGRISKETELLVTGLLQNDPELASFSPFSMKAQKKD